MNTTYQFICSIFRYYHKSYNFLFQRILQKLHVCGPYCCAHNHSQARLTENSSTMAEEDSRGKMILGLALYSASHDWLKLDVGTDSSWQRKVAPTMGWSTCDARMDG